MTLKHTYITPEIDRQTLLNELPIAVSGNVDGTPTISESGEGEDPGAALAPWIKPKGHWDTLHDED